MGVELLRPDVGVVLQQPVHMPLGLCHQIGVDGLSHDDISLAVIDRLHVVMHGFLLR